MAVHDLIVKNESNHDQRFQVHGWNNNQDIVVRPKSEYRIKANDGSSGAIIAIHDGQIGEQAELTKSGFGGNDFIDLSNICGAGGNLIVMQVGEPSTAKGDPRFMQGLQDAWNRASQQTKNELANCVTVRDGRPIRIAAPKNFPKLEAFVRTFADGKTYIGVGAWGGRAGNPNDNKQSSAAKGSKDCLIIYSDDPIWIPNQPRLAAMSDEEIPLVGLPNLDDAETKEPESDHSASSDGDNSESNEHSDDAGTHSTPLPPTLGGEDSPVRQRPRVVPHPEETTPETETEKAAVEAEHVHDLAFTTLAANQGPGIILTNKSNKETDYFFYDNFWNGNGTAGANFDKPLKSVKLWPNQTQFVSLPRTFKGRVQRGTQLPCTWVEFQLDASNDHAAHGDISLQQGCDGAATIASTDGSNVSNGFTHDVVSGAPEAAIRKKPNGERATDTTVGNWMGGPNRATIDYLNKVVGQRRAYIVGGTGVPDVASKNNCLAVVMY